MKTIIVLSLIVIAVYSCRTGRDIQVDFINARLIKIDTVHKFDKFEKLLTWQDDDEIRYVSYVPMDRHVFVGMKFLVMRRQ